MIDFGAAPDSCVHLCYDTNTRILYMAAPSANRYVPLAVVSEDLARAVGAAWTTEGDEALGQVAWDENFRPRLRR